MLGASEDGDGSPLGAPLGASEDGAASDGAVVGASVGASDGEAAGVLHAAAARPIASVMDKASRARRIMGSYLTVLGVVPEDLRGKERIGSPIALTPSP